MNIKKARRLRKELGYHPALKRAYVVVDKGTKKIETHHMFRGLRIPIEYTVNCKTISNKQDSLRDRYIRLKKIYNTTKGK